MQNHGVDPFGIVGQVLDGQFRVDRLVGEGGFSAVYRGHHLGLEEPIAIKCLKLPPSLSPALVDQFAKRFRDESRILYRLSQGNLNIVRSIAAGTWQANTGAVVPYMILEWMDGRSVANEFTIRRTVGQQGRPLAEVVKVFGPAADGLGYAHSQGVVHRDLNPGNLFLAASPQGTRMKVLDFGVAKILDDSTLNIARTQTVGAIRIFAPAYGAPEQFDDAIGPVGAATDVYAFALILLEALRDRCVNDGQHLGEFAQRAVDPARRPTPRSLGIAVPDEVEQIFVRATKLDPRERWQSAGELWQALAIAASAASQQRHVQAAAETPALAMPPGVRSTRQGMAPPPHAADSHSGVLRAHGAEAPSVAQLPPKTQGTVRMDKTMPIGSVMPNFAAMRPSSAGDEVPALHGPEDGEDMPTKVGARSPQTRLSEPEDEVTRVRAPEPEMLRGLVENEARGRGANMPVGAPRPAAGAPPVPDVVPPSGGGTLMVNNANAFVPGMAPTHPMQSPVQPAHEPSGKHNLAKTMPLVGAHPLGLSSPHPSSSGPLPAAGTPVQQPHAQQPPPQQQPYPPQHQGPSQQQQQQQQQMQQAMLQPPPPHVPMHGQPAHFAQHGRMADSVSMPPASIAGVPKKTNPMLFVGLGLGALALIGVILTVVVLTGKNDGKGAAGSASVPSASIPSVSASAPPPVPPPAPTPEPDPVPAAVADASDAVVEVVDAGSPAVTPTAAPTAAPDVAPTPTPTQAPTQTPVVVKDAGPPPDPNAFSESTARSRLSQANGVLAFCKKTDGPTGPGSAVVTFVPDGTVSEVSISPPFAGTPVGDCVVGQLKRTKSTPFKGSPQSLKHSFEVPK